MTQEEKQLLLKDICARLSYGVIIHVEGIIGGNYLNGDSKLVGIHNGIIHVENQTTYGNYEGFPLSINIKPYLRLMSSMTSDEKKKFDSLMNKVEERCINAYGKGGYTLAFTELNDWLNAHYFDYRGLIEKGFALEAPEGMYKTE